MSGLFFVVLVIETRACTYWASALPLVTSQPAICPFVSGHTVLHFH